MFTDYVVDASMGCNDGLFCVCPVRLDENDEIESIIVGFNILTDKQGLPNYNIIGVVHEDGDEAAEEFVNEHGLRRD